MNTTIKALFERFTELANLPTTSERNTDEDRKENNLPYYKNDFWIMEYDKFYRGYRIEKVLTSTGHDTPFSLGLKTKNEMEQFLRGLIEGLTFNKHK